MAMTYPLPSLVEHSLQISWDFVDGAGKICNPQQTAEFLLREVRDSALKGDERTLMLSNRAITGYLRTWRKMSEAS
jgi:hypothetical protein